MPGYEPGDGGSTPPGATTPASFNAEDAPVLTERRRLNSFSGDQLGRRERRTLARLLSGGTSGFESPVGHHSRRGGQASSRLINGCAR
jgi:hypothetical protein